MVSTLGLEHEEIGPLAAIVEEEGPGLQWSEPGPFHEALKLLLGRARRDVPQDDGVRRRHGGRVRL